MDMFMRRMRFRTRPEHSLVHFHIEAGAVHAVEETPPFLLLAANVGKLATMIVLGRQLRVSRLLLGARVSPRERSHL